jgi:hypothetical protein
MRRFGVVLRARLACASNGVPALAQLDGLLSYDPGVDPITNTVVNVSVWHDLAAAKQMDRLAAMLAQRPILEKAGVVFDAIASYEPLWRMEA